MDTLIVHDTVLQIKTVVDTVTDIDTLLIQTADKKASLETWAPWIAFAVTLIGWAVNLSFSRIFQKKSFEEGVMDRIRLVYSDN